MGENPFFELHDAVVRRGGKDILSVEALSLEEGAGVAVLGPNGSGKSTLIGLITRELLPLHRDDPPVRFRGSGRATLVDVRAATGIVSATMQNQIRVHLSALDVVIGGLFGSLGVPRGVAATSEQQSKALFVMEDLGIADLAMRDVMTLSSGQVRRVLIARALIHGPDVLIFDEPCTGLDPEGMYHVRRTMRHLAQAGKAIVLVTHYPEDIIPEIERIVLLKEGRVFADGRKEELLADEMMSQLFDVPLRVTCSEGYYALASSY